MRVNQNLTSSWNQSPYLDLFYILVKSRSRQPWVSTALQYSQNSLKRVSKIHHTNSCSISLPRKTFPHSTAKVEPKSSPHHCYLSCIPGWLNMLVMDSLPHLFGQQGIYSMLKTFQNFYFSRSRRSCPSSLSACCAGTDFRGQGNQSVWSGIWAWWHNTLSEPYYSVRIHEISMKGKVERTEFRDPSKHRMRYWGSTPNQLCRDTPGGQDHCRCTHSALAFPYLEGLPVLAGVNWINKQWELHSNYL